MTKSSAGDGTVTSHLESTIASTSTLKKFVLTKTTHSRQEVEAMVDDKIMRRRRDGDEPFGIDHSLDFHPLKKFVLTKTTHSR